MIFSTQYARCKDIQLLARNSQYLEIFSHRDTIVYMVNCAKSVIDVWCFVYITYVLATHVLHMYVYICNTCVGYAPVLHV